MRARPRLLVCECECVLAVKECSQRESEEVSTAHCLRPSGTETKQDLPTGTHIHSPQLQMTYYPPHTHRHTQSCTYTWRQSLFDDIIVLVSRGKNKVNYHTWVNECTLPNNASYSDHLSHPLLCFIHLFFHSLRPLIPQATRWHDRASVRMCKSWILLQPTMSTKLVLFLSIAVVPKLLS